MILSRYWALTSFKAASGVAFIIIGSGDAYPGVRRNSSPWDRSSQRRLCFLWGGHQTTRSDCSNSTVDGQSRTTQNYSRNDQGRYVAWGFPSGVDIVGGNSCHLCWAAGFDSSWTQCSLCWLIPSYRSVWSWLSKQSTHPDRPWRSGSVWSRWMTSDCSWSAGSASLSRISLGSSIRRDQKMENQPPVEADDYQCSIWRDNYVNSFFSISANSGCSMWL